MRRVHVISSHSAPTPWNQTILVKTIKRQKREMASKMRSSEDAESEAEIVDRKLPVTMPPTVLPTGRRVLLLHLQTCCQKSDPLVGRQLPPHRRRRLRVIIFVL